ncbi:hypothetical protein BGZ54_007765 [Gamsiella multidivaricata]|nr:hypothetical protein BGZ54_007765 [Gamsiella multidivaricata]
MPSLSSSSSSSTLSSGHFPLFKPSFSSLQNQGSGGHQKPRPSPLSLHTSNTHGQEVGSGGVHLEGRASPSFSVRPSSPTSALSGDSTTATDIAGSPRAASATVAANLDGSSPLLPRSSLYQNNFGTMSSAASISDSSYYSNTSSPSTLTSPCSALCHHSRSRSRHHHPACQHHTDLQQSAPELESEPIVQHGPKPGRATKGVHRFGLPQFRPEIDDSHFGTVAIMKTTSTSTSGSGYGIQRASRDDDDYLDEPGTYEPPKKRLRSTASMLLDAAVETVIFTGAVALSAYQLLTGKGRLGHSKQSSMASNDADNATATGETSKAQEEDPMEEKLALQMDTSAVATPRAQRPYSYAGTTARSTRTGGYHKARTPRVYRSRQSYMSSGNLGHSRTLSMPVRPNTGTEDTDEAFLRMEAQLNSLIAEGKRALNSRIEVWDEE